jgi:pimeloyl-ACP methyl ester carboxylesterase
LVCLLGLALWLAFAPVRKETPAPEKSVPTTYLRSAKLIATDPAEAIYQRHRVPGTQEWFRHDVKVYRLTYATHDVDGTEVTVSGAVLVPAVPGPMPTMCYLRGTIIPVEEEKYAPSYYNLENDQSIYDNYEMSFLGAGFAAAGYFTVAPDMIGYGASKDREHPYGHAPSLAWVSRDMLRAAREFAKKEGIVLDERLFITGWSEGGLGGMALHELLEREPAGGFTVRGSSLLAGPYAPSAHLDWFCCIDEPYPEQRIRYWILRSMLRVHRIARPFHEIVQPKYAKGLMHNVMGPVPENPREGLTPAFRAGMQARTETEIRRAFEDSDRFDWRPQVPVFLHHGTHDDIVPFFLSQMAYQAMRARDGTVRLYPYIGKDHYKPVNAYVVRTLADFARLQGEKAVPAGLAQQFDPPRAVPSPDGSLLATGHWDGTLKLIDATTGKELITLQKGIGRKEAEISAENMLPTISFSPDGKMLASHRANEDVRVWDVANGEQVATFEGHGQLLAFSSDGKLLAVYARHAGDRTGGTVQIWRLATKKQRAVIETKEDLKEVHFSANGQMLITTSAPSEGKVAVTVWEIKTGKARVTASGVSAQVVAGGKTLVVLTTEGGITLWDLNTGKKRAEFDLYTPDK